MQNEFERTLNLVQGSSSQEIHLSHISAHVYLKVYHARTSWRGTQPGSNIAEKIKHVGRRRRKYHQYIPNTIFRL
jgi:hypothetical protein